MRVWIEALRRLRVTLIVVFVALALAGCAASTKVRSTAAPTATKQLGKLATLSLMGALDEHDQGVGYQSACSTAFTQYYQAHDLKGVVMAPSLTSLDPNKEIQDTLDRSHADTLLVVSPVDTESTGAPDYTMIHVDASLYSASASGRIWRALINLRPNTYVYFRGDKHKTCTRLITDIFQRLQQDGFQPNAPVPPGESQSAT